MISPVLCWPPLQYCWVQVVVCPGSCDWAPEGKFWLFGCHFYCLWGNFCVLRGINFASGSLGANIKYVIQGIQMICAKGSAQNIKSGTMWSVTLQSTITASRRSWAVRVGHKWEAETWFQVRSLNILLSICGTMKILDVVWVTDTNVIPTLI